jgi:hypothetical protein
VRAGGSGLEVGAGPLDFASDELLLPSIAANGAVAAFDVRPSSRQASEGQVQGRAAPGPSENFWRARHLGRASTIGTPPEVVVSRAGT